MPVPLTGAINLNKCHREAGGTNFTQVGMGDSDMRALANDFSGQISMSQFRGGCTVTQGYNGTSLFGYSDGTHGSGDAAYGSVTKIHNVGISGVDLERLSYTKITTTIKGVTTTSHYFNVSFAGNRGQSFFTSVFESSLGTLLTSNATHAYVSAQNYTNWNWTLSSEPSNWDGSGALKVKLA